jgi:hypothetical protein
MLPEPNALAYLSAALLTTTKKFFNDDLRSNGCFEYRGMMAGIDGYVFGEVCNCNRPLCNAAG